MKVRGRERVAFNFKKVLELFFGNGNSYSYVKDYDIKKEVNEIREQENREFIKKMEDITASYSKKAGGKKNDMLNVGKSETKNLDVPAKQNIRDEER